jgi:REP element-mobilizing transposase RayT
MQELHFFNPYSDILQTKNRLPHWQQTGAVYFVTFRLSDAVPIHLLREWETQRENWLRIHPEPWTDLVEREYHERFSARIERWLDAGYGECILRKPEYAQVVAETLRYFEGVRVGMISYVVMPNHVHALLVQNPDWLLDELIRSWKRFSARTINRMRNRKGHLWQRDYFDRLVRDDQHFANCVRYIRRNPIKAGLREDEFIFWESELAKNIPVAKLF